MRGGILLATLCCALTGRAESTSAVNAATGKATSAGQFDVIVAGGSTAALAAAVAAAHSGARTALIEPTDWIGGQLTASGVPAIDEAWHTVRGADDHSDADDVNVAAIARLPANITPNFHALLQAIDDPGDCWVSRYCFCPNRFLQKQLLPLQAQCGGNLTVFLNAVIKRVEVDDSLGGGAPRLQSLTAIVRTPRPDLAASGYDRLPSQDLADWYSPHDSPRFTKRVVLFGEEREDAARNELKPSRSPVFIDATEWGEVLALSGGDYLQGAEETEGSLECRDRCGQATVFCFVEEFRREPASTSEPPARACGVERKNKTSPDDHTLGFGAYRDKPDAWKQIWTYRRIRGRGEPAPGDLCLQNWGYSSKLHEGGNDYPFGYLLLGRDAAARQRTDWQGGVDLAVMAAAEERAFAWHEWFRRHGPGGISPEQIVLQGEPLGTAHGLAKLPYIRDTRRSIGLDGFVLKMADLCGPAAQVTGTKFPDRAALGAYAADIHGLDGCELPDYLHAEHEPLPFTIPFRALTHAKFGNLLVAGKTMAQSFLANSATRLHPIEWSTGTAAGVAAAYMARTGKTSRAAYDSIPELQNLIRRQTPIDWTIPEKSGQN